MGDNQFKMRAWDKKFKRMLELSDNCFVFHSEDWSFTDQACTVMENKNGSYILLLRTGLKDKNDVEIYHGDILRFTNVRAAAPFVIMWDCNGAKFTEYSPRDAVEIIGSIYEDPGLLRS